MLLHLGFTGSLSHTQTNHGITSPAKAPTSVVVVETLAWVLSVVDVDTPTVHHRYSMAPETGMVGAATVLQTIK